MLVSVDHLLTCLHFVWQLAGGDSTDGAEGGRENAVETLWDEVINERE